MKIMKCALQKKNLALFFTVFTTFCCHSMAYGSYQSTVCNKTGKTLEVVWTGAGCSNIKDKHTEVCRAIHLGAGNCQSYNYKSGTSNRNVHVGSYVKIKQVNRSIHIVDGGYYDSYNCQVGTSGNCHHHADTGKTINISSFKSSLDCASKDLIFVDKYFCTFDFNCQFALS